MSYVDSKSVEDRNKAIKDLIGQRLLLKEMKKETAGSIFCYRSPFPKPLGETHEAMRISSTRETV